jgi:ribosomal subunit interface protein
MPSKGIPMKLPLQISFRGMESSPALERRIREKVQKLERFHDRLMSCRVVVEARTRRQRKGKLYQVRIDLKAPKFEIAVGHTGRRDQAHEDIYVALRDAFNAAGRQLEDHARVARSDVKAHEPPPHGRIVRLFKRDGYGFIQAADGQEIYFHANSVGSAAFKALRVGKEVRFALAEGEGIEGPQATTVLPVGKHHVVG